MTESRRLLLASIAAAVASAGCAAWRGVDGASARHEALADDRACVTRGLAFPTADYTRCRRELADARLKEQWLELSMAQLQRRQQAPEFLEVPPPQPYRPLDPRAFTCAEQSDAQGTWIACRER